jgi:hypothetical protein
MIRRVAIALIPLALVGCSSFEAAACDGADDPSAKTEIAMPATIGGLKVREEGEATEKLNVESDPAGTYQCPGTGRVYSLRKGKELRAVLQVSRLAPDARLDDIDFVRGLVRGITGGLLEPEEVDGVDVYTATGANQQLISSWFTDRFMFFLTVREDETVAGLAVGVDFKAVRTEAVRLAPVPAL